MSEIKTAVFPVAGRATRALPMSKVVPKCLFPVGNKPLIHYAVAEAVQAGCSSIVFVVDHGYELIKKYFDRDSKLENFLVGRGQEYRLLELQKLQENAEFTYVRQETVNGYSGLGASIYSARKVVSDHYFAIVLPNDLIFAEPGCLSQLIKIYREHTTSVLACQTVSNEAVETYGNLKAHSVQEGLYKVENLIQRPRVEERFSNLAIIGRYIVSRTVLDFIGSAKAGFDNEIQLTDALKQSVFSGSDLLALEFKGQYYDTRTPNGLSQACGSMMALSED